MEAYINNLNSKKSIPKHSTPIKIIKLSCKIIAPFLTKIFNTCIFQGIFPDKLKYAQVTPIYKQGDKTKVNNHRPISVLSPFAKIFECHLQIQLTKFLNKNNILHQSQFGFRTNSSTEMAITQITEDIINKLQNNQTTCTVFLDLRKAFDTVNHDVLLTKLRNYGVRGITFNLFKSYLSNRTQQTIIGDSISDIEQLNCGIPQGSILGPKFFNIYINDIIYASNLSVKLFADDACLSYSSHNINDLEQTINNELKIITNWRKANKLSINFKKSNYMVFTRKKNKINIQISIEGNKLDRVDETKYLGVLLDHKLSWKDHANYITNKVSKASYIISKIRHYVDLPILKMIYYSLVHPHLNYCLTAWGGTCNTTLKPLITVQKRIVRIMTSSPFDSSSRPIFLKLGILPLNKLYNLNLSLLMHKIFNNKITGSYNLTLTSNTHNLNTRSSKNKNYFKKFNKLNIGLNSFTSNGTKIWNKIPVDSKNKPLHLFKKDMKQYLINSLKEQIT